MNTATATQRLQAICVLSLALLASLTSDGAHEHTGGNRSEQLIRASPGCADSHEPQENDIDHLSCNTPGDFESLTPPPMRLVKPLSGSQYLRSGDNIRYSF